MVNRSFSRLSKEEKEAKLQAALRCMTDNALTETELRAVSHAVPLNRQYFIHVHRSFETFSSDIMYPAQRHIQFVIGSHIAAQCDIGAVLQRSAKTGDPITAVVNHANGKNGIYILIPKRQNKEGTIP
ncbi:MAG: hypothetical protein ACI3W5_02025 [Faecousia sp.]